MRVFFHVRSPAQIPPLARSAIAAALVAMTSACVGQPAATAPTGSDAAPVVASPAMVARGRLLFLRCASCHSIDDQPVAKTGPTMKGVFGRPAASSPGYSYSAALKSRSLVWDAATLDRWIDKPTQVVPETTMAFIGLPEAADRQALIAYLKTLR